MNLQEFNSLSNVDKSNYIQKNFRSIKNSLSKRRIVRAVGVNDADYVVKPKIDNYQVECPAFAAWRRMLCRANDKKYKEKNKTYQSVSSCKEWSSFMSFRAWWIDNQVDGWHLDKDILSDLKIYSPETCIYVPCWINTMANENKSSRGRCKVGVYFNCGRFISKCSHPIDGVLYLGSFKNENKAYEAWLNKKLEIANELKKAMDDIDGRIYDGIVRIIKNSI